MALKFKWNGRKAASNKRKHSVSFEEASMIFSDFLSITIPDPLHSEEKERLVTIGLSEKQRNFVVHMERDDVISIISARVANAHERKTYEKGNG